MGFDDKTGVVIRAHGGHNGIKDGIRIDLKIQFDIPIALKPAVQNPYKAALPGFPSAVQQDHILSMDAVFFQYGIKLFTNGGIIGPCSVAAIFVQGPTKVEFPADLLEEGLGGGMSLESHFFSFQAPPLIQYQNGFVRGPSLKVKDMGKEFFPAALPVFGPDLLGLPVLLQLGQQFTSGGFK